MGKNSFPGHRAAEEKRSIDQIYAAAKKESGSLKVAWGGDEKRAGLPVVEAFTKRFPGIKLDLTVDLSKYHDSRADRAWAVSGGQTDGMDIAVLQTVHDFVRWKGQGRLMNYKPLKWAEVYPAFRDEEGSFLGCFIYSFGSIVYNNATLTEDDVPSSYADFVQPRWHSKLTLTLPNDDDAIAYLFSQIIQTHGWPWLSALAQQNVTWVRGSATPATLLSTTPSLLASFTTSNRSGGKMAAKAPSDPYMQWPQTGAIFKSTKMPESARLFMSFIMSDEWQAELAKGGIGMTRRDLQPEGTTVWEGENLEPMGFGRWMADRENVEWWKLQFETTLGTPQGISPLEDDL
ncbi:hypothetical protein EDC01DRAFT_619413 [Geopyxis carbonaria]|nr:hypothetical protein EDC01DRAFT_619413 [Geopyxis carbonaria]